MKTLKDLAFLLSHSAKYVCQAAPGEKWEALQIAIRTILGINWGGKSFHRKKK